MQHRSIHPFPARMAPDIALKSLGGLPAGSTVLDPMAGSGTVLRQALAQGHHAVGFDMDPLAVLMSGVWTSPVDPDAVKDRCETIIKRASALDLRTVRLPWIDDDAETKAFIHYWFAAPQRRDLRRLAAALHGMREPAASSPVSNVLRVGLSRIIVTKERGASLARDTSHSRPHKVSEISDYNVMAGFRRSCAEVCERLKTWNPTHTAQVRRGDARLLPLRDKSVNAVITSPPYLNAIDYLRGHRLSLVWLGHTLGSLRTIRSDSIGAERAADKNSTAPEIAEIIRVIGDVDQLSKRHRSMIERYAFDLLKMTSEIHRVLSDGGRATFVVGNSCLKGVFVQNSEAVARAAKFSGMTLIESTERDLPQSSRYLPMTNVGMLSKRMRTETVLTFRR